MAWESAYGFAGQAASEFGGLNQWPVPAWALVMARRCAVFSGHHVHTMQHLRKLLPHNMLDYPQAACRAF